MAIIRLPNMNPPPPSSTPAIVPLDQLAPNMAVVPSGQTTTNVTSLTSGQVMPSLSVPIHLPELNQTPLSVAGSGFSLMSPFFTPLIHPPTSHFSFPQVNSVPSQPAVRPAKTPKRAKKRPATKSLQEGDLYKYLRQIVIATGAAEHKAAELEFQRKMLEFVPNPNTPKGPCDLELNTTQEDEIIDVVGVDDERDPIPKKKICIE